MYPLNNFIRLLSDSLCTARTLPYLEILCYMVGYLSSREYCETFSQISRIVIVRLDIISIKISTQLLWYPWEIYDLKMDNGIEIQQIVGGVDLEKLENHAPRRRPLFMWVTVRQFTIVTSYCNLMYILCPSVRVQLASPHWQSQSVLQCLFIFLSAQTASCHLS